MADHVGPADPDARIEPYLAAGETRPGGRRLRSTALIVAVMAVFAGGLWLAYLLGGRRAAGSSGPVPLIRAAPGPLKRKPAEPGGMQIPGRHMLIFGERQPKVEHLLPPPPEPMPLPRPPSPPASQAQAAPSPPAPAEATSAAPPANPATAPLRARPPAAAPATPAKPEAAPPPPAAKPTAKPPAASTAHEAERGGPRVQLGALRSPEAARREWDRLKRTNPKLLGRLSAFAVRTDLGKRGVFYRVVTAPFADAAAAERLCAALKRRHVGCFVVHR